MKFTFLSYILLISFFTCFGQDSLLQEADQYFEEQKLEEALESYKQAAAAFRQSNQLALYARCNVRIARCYLAFEHLEQALSQGENTLEYLQELLPEKKDLIFENQILLGEVYLKVGRNDLCLETLREAETYIAGVKTLKAAECYNDLGVAYWNNKNMETARAYHERALLLRRELLGEHSVEVADSYLNLGLIYQETDFLKAIIHFNEALDIYRAVLGEHSAQVALCFNNLAFANSSQNNFAEALSYLDKTMQIWEQKYEGDHPNKAFTLSNKGRVLEARGDYHQALQMQQESLKMYLRLYGKKHPEVANTYFLIGSVQAKQEEYQLAIESFQESIYANLYTQNYTSVYDLPSLSEYYNADILLSSLQYKAQTLEAFHFEKSLRPRDIKGALDTYLKCDDLISQIRQRRLSEGDKIRIGAIAADVYDNGIRIALYLSSKTFQPDHYREIAFNFCERSKSAVLLEAIGDTKAKSFAGIPDELIAYEDSIKTEIAWIERQLAGGSDEQNATVLKNALFNSKQLYRDFVTGLETDYPNYYKLKYQRSNISASELQEKLNPYTAIISYFIGDQSIYIFTISSKDFSVVIRPREDDFLKQAKGLRNSIKYRIPSGLHTSASALYRQLIPEISPGIRELIIIPDGVLGTLPFESFIAEIPDGQAPRYLLEQYAISYDYAATLLAERLGTDESSAQGILLAAPVSFEGNDAPMNTLPGSEQEVREIKYLFLSFAHEPEVLLKDEANEASVKNASLAEYKYLHFATHGIVNESRPELSRIFLSPDQMNDGSLYSGEIYTLDINADLVTLSACETGLGKIEQGEGIIGLSRSLMYAGAKNLVVSLWQVADASTAQLMIEFYRQHLHHSGNMIFADDLQKAKLSLLHSSDYKDPYFWAAFILIGK